MSEVTRDRLGHTTSDLGRRGLSVRVPAPLNGDARRLPHACVIERVTVDDDSRSTSTRSEMVIPRVCAIERATSLAARRVHHFLATHDAALRREENPVKTIAAIIIAGALSTFPGAGRADDVKTDKAQQACPAAATEQGVREHAAACACRTPKARTGATDPQQAVRPYDPVVGFEPRVSELSRPQTARSSIARAAQRSPGGRPLEARREERGAGAPPRGAGPR